MVREHQARRHAECNAYEYCLGNDQERQQGDGKAEQNDPLSTAPLTLVGQVDPDCRSDEWKWYSRLTAKRGCRGPSRVAELLRTVGEHGGKT